MSVTFINDSGKDRKKEFFVKPKPVFGIVSLLIILSFVFISLCLAGCDNGTTSSGGGGGKKYEYDVFTLTQTDFNSVPMPISWTFTNMKNFYTALSAKPSVSTLLKDSGASEKDIYDFLIANDFTTSEAKDEIDFLKSKGNNIIWGTYTGDANSYVVMYVEKL